MKKILLGASVSLLLLSGCMSVGLSPEVKKSMKENSITEYDVCEAAGKTIYSKGQGKDICNMFYIATEEDVNRAIEIKKRAKIEQDKSRKAAKLKAEKAKIEAKIEADKKAKIEADKKAKIAADKKAKAKVEARIQKLGVSQAYIIKFVNRSGYCQNDNGYAADTIYEPLSNSDIDVYEKCKIIKKKSLKSEQVSKKKAAKKKAAYERKAKIKTGKQYVCTDGYDSWILKFNGNRITFGGLGMFMNILGGYQINKYDNDILFIDRLKGTANYQGNKLTCKKR